MKRIIVLGVLMLSAVYVGSIFTEPAAAQRKSPGRAIRPVEPPIIGDKSIDRPDNSVPQPLPFSQNWSNPGLITVNDDWSGVVGIQGFLGQDITTGTGIDPRTLLTTSALANDIDVIAQTTPANTSGGVGEMDTLPDPTIALQGSGTADVPNIILYLNTTGQNNIRVSYNARDIDGTTDNAVQPINTQYRVGSTGNFINVPGGFIADATTGPSLANLVTPVAVTLPAAASDQPEVQVRIMTTNAVGSDEWVGIDDISVTTVATAARSTAPSDFNGDGITDYAVVRTTAGNGGTQARWFIQYNGSLVTNQTVDWGLV
ncbi:MAG: hypothetical protein ABIO36_08305, partial [Pyrinomonadaceae bacterium]